MALLEQTGPSSLPQSTSAGHKDAMMLADQLRLGDYSLAAERQDTPEWPPGMPEPLVLSASAENDSEWTGALTRSE